VDVAFDRRWVQRVAEMYPPSTKLRPQLRGNVYFIQEGEDGPVKIGWAINPKRRLAAMQTGNARPLRLLGAISTKRRPLEREVHKRFSADRLAGEWFAVSDALVSYIDAHSDCPEA